MAYVVHWLKGSGCVTFFVILAKKLPIFVSIFGLLDCRDKKKSLCRIGASWGAGAEGVKTWDKYALFRTGENDSDL